MIKYQVIPFLLACVITVLMFWDQFALWEGRAYPVVTKLEILESRRTDNTITFFAQFVKKRECPFIETQWYKNGVRLLIDYEPDADQFPSSRPSGLQVVGPWKLHGVDSLNGVVVRAKHQCHPGWPTITEFYP